MKSADIILQLIDVSASIFFSLIIFYLSFFRYLLYDAVMAHVDVAYYASLP